MFPSCKSQSPTTASTGSTILLNSSFESSGSPSSDGWTIPSSPMGGYSTDVPPNGGTYSIFLEASNPGGSASVEVALPLGAHIFRFSLWAKTASITGRADLQFVPANGQSILSKRMDIPDTTWREYSIDDTLTAQTGDSVKVFLFAGIGEVIISRTYFDLCKIEEIK
jgi:hypothetical protein